MRSLSDSRSEPKIPAITPQWPLRLSYATQKLRRSGGHECWALGDQTLVSASNFFTNVLIARHLGLHEFGVFTLAWMTVQFVSSLQNAAIISPMMSIGAKQRGDVASKYYSGVVAGEFCFSVTAAVIIWAAASTIGLVLARPSLTAIAAPLAAALLCFQLQDFARRYFFTRMLPRLATLNDLVGYGTQVLLLVLLPRRLLSSSSNLLLVIAGTSFAAVILAALQSERVRWHGLGHVYKTFRRHWTFSKWLAGSALMQWTSGNFFVLTAAAVLGPSIAGVIRLAENIMGVTHILFLGLDNVVPRHAAALLHEGGVPAMRNYLRSIGGFVTGLTSAFALSVVLTAHLWVRWVYGLQYQDCAYVLQWYGLLYVLISLRLPLSAALRALEVSKPLFTAYMATTLFALSTAAIGVRHFGLIGALVGMVATQTLLNTILAMGLRNGSRTAPENPNAYQ